MEICTTLDANSGYGKVENEQEYKDKTAFKSHRGIFRFIRILFGLNKVPGSFQRISDIILAQVRWKYDFVYRDDLIFFIKSV